MIEVPSCEPLLYKQKYFSAELDMRFDDVQQWRKHVRASDVLNILHLTCFFLQFCALRTVNAPYVCHKGSAYLGSKDIVLLV